jgi:hypothetical protein
MRRQRLDGLVCVPALPGRGTHLLRPVGGTSWSRNELGCGSPKPKRCPFYGLGHVSRPGYAEPMVTRIIHVVLLLIVLASRHRTLVLENLALHQQLALYRRTRPKPPIRRFDRLFWIGLRWVWRDWKSALMVVQPATVVAWHRRGFAWYWTRRSRPRGGRPQIGADVRRLVREMVVAKPTLGCASHPWGIVEAGV